eukprot:364658-Chlamydomonas_euryale.AAC.2
MCSTLAHAAGAAHVHAGAWKAIWPCMCAAALFAIDKARRRMLTAFAAHSRLSGPNEPGRVGCHALQGHSLRDCAEAAAACTVAGLCAE